MCYFKQMWSVSLLSKMILTQKYNSYNAKWLFKLTDSELDTVRKCLYSKYSYKGYFGKKSVCSNLLIGNIYDGKKTRKRAKAKKTCTSVEPHISGANRRRKASV